MYENYDMNFLYNPGKANVIVDSLSRMTMDSLSHIDEAKKYLVKDAHRLVRLGVILEHPLDGCFTVHNSSESSLVVEVKSI